MEGRIAVTFDEVAQFRVSDLEDVGHEKTDTKYAAPLLVP